MYIKGFIDFELDYSSAVGMVMPLNMMIAGVVYFRLVVMREFKDIL